MLTEKILGERRYVFSSLSQRRKINRHNVKAIVEIFTEPSFLNETLQIPVGGGDDPDIDRNGYNTPNPLELTLLKERKSLACSSPETSPISSKKIVPPWANSILPVLRRCAPVNAPCSWPNSSLSKSSFDDPPS